MAWAWPTRARFANLFLPMTQNVRNQPQCLAALYDVFTDEFTAKDVVEPMWFRCRFERLHNDRCRRAQAAAGH